MTTTHKTPRTDGSAADSRKLVVQTFLSMDGVMQAPGGPEEDPEAGFRYGGWSMAYWDEVMGRAMTEFLAEPAEVVLGRKTYDIFAAYWPQHRDQTGSSLNGATKHVASRTKKHLDWENSRLLQGDVVAAIQQLKQQPGLPLHVVGSANLVQTLLKSDLVDELDLWVFPVVLGTGKRLFHDGAIPTAWKLTHSQASGTGVLMQHYVRAGEISYGRIPGT
jgi:dihydrofolate reductase